MIQFKLNEIMHESTIISPSEVTWWYKNMCKISFLLPNLVAFFRYTVNIHLEKGLMRCNTKSAIWWDLYTKHISIFCIKHMSTIFRTLQVNKWWSKNWMFLSFCEVNATKFGTKLWFRLDCIMQLKLSYYIATYICSRKSATTFDDLPDCTVTTVGFVVTVLISFRSSSQDRQSIGKVSDIISRA